MLSALYLLLFSVPNGKEASSVLLLLGSRVDARGEGARELDCEGRAECTGEAL
jgi:hypothetical protein